MKTFIIYLKEREHSVRQAKEMFSQLKEYGHDVHYFEGISGKKAVELAKKDRRTVYPFSIKSNRVEPENIQKYVIPELWKEFSTQYSVEIYEKSKYNKQEIEKISSPGVIGCFYSHYVLWQKCVDLDEPIIIFEDDIKFFRNVEITDWDDILILALGKSSYLKEPWKTYLEKPTDTPRVVPWRNATMPGNQGYAIKPKAAKKLLKTYNSYFLPADNAINQNVCRMEISTHIMGREMSLEEGNISSIRTKGEPW